MMRRLGIAALAALVLGGQAQAAELLAGSRLQQNLQMQHSLQSAQRQAAESRLRRQIYQAEQRINRQLDQRAVLPVAPPHVPEFVPTCQGNVRGTPDIPLRCR